MTDSLHLNLKTEGILLLVPICSVQDEQMDAHFVVLYVEFNLHFWLAGHFTEFH